MTKSLLLLPGLALLALSSCKKTYTCECSTDFTYRSSSSGSLFTATYPGETTQYSEKMREKQAKAACAHEAPTIEKNFSNFITDNGKFPLKSGEKITTSCSIKL